jgi:hypothetical protein
MESYKIPEQALDPEKIIEDIEKSRINPDDFRNNRHFDAGDIDADLSHCQNLHGIFDDQKKRYTAEQQAQYERGLAAEYTLRHAIEEHGWLSENIHVIVTSVYDDYVRGIDSVMQIVLGEGRYEHLGFAIDFASGAENVGDKIRRTFDMIDQGYAPSVKYFDSPKTGQLKNFKVPRIIVGGGPENLQRLAAYSAEILNDSGISDRVKESIKTDPFRAILFGEIEAQLSVFIHRLEKVIAQAREEQRFDIEERAKSSLKMHQVAFEVIEDLAKEAGIDTDAIRKDIKGDIFAVKMAQALSLLSMTPIMFKQKQER